MPTCDRDRPQALYEPFWALPAAQGAGPRSGLRAADAGYGWWLEKLEHHASPQVTRQATRQDTGTDMTGILAGPARVEGSAFIAALKAV